MKPEPTDAVKGGENPIQTFAVLGTASQCDHPDHVQFCRDMAAAGIATHIGKGRLGWHGPMAHAKDVFDIMSKTQVRCIWDECGKDVLVYPAVYTESCLYKLVANLESTEIGIGIYLHQGHPVGAIARNAMQQIQDFISEIGY